jgi:hypothetical protein
MRTLPILSACSSTRKRLFISLSLGPIVAVS